MSEQTNALHLARSRILELEQALSDLLLLPVAVQEFHYLDRGIGTKTFNAAWLRARSVLNKENGGRVVDPTDPGHDVAVLREHVRHLERRIRELHAERNAGMTDAPKENDRA